MANSKYKHIKLDKFVSGTEQRIFKTTTHILSAEITNNIHNFNVIKTNKNRMVGLKKDVFYAEYSSDININKSINQPENIISGNLINFHDINYDYLTNRPDKLSNISIDSPNSPWFSNAVTNAQYDSEKNKDERVTYFPQHIETPIDIAYSRNNSYFLLPINTAKYTNLVQSDVTSLYKNSGPNANFKPNYNAAFNELWSKSFYTAEDNSIPIYDLNFTFLQSINLGSNNKVIEWIKKFDLDKFTYTEHDKINNMDVTVTLSSQILFDSESNTNNMQTADSIRLQPLLTVLSKYDYIFSEQRKKDIIHDLIANLDIYSTARFLSPIGQITKLNKNVISGFISNTNLSLDFSKENIFDIHKCFTAIPDNQFTPEVLPNNVLLGSDVRYSLEYKNNNKKEIKESFPSGYYNILYLKNNRTPHYDFNYFLPNSGYINGLYDYIITDNTDIPISAGNVNDTNMSVNNCFDIDATRSLLFNSDSKYNIVTNKNKTKELISYAADKDLEQSLLFPETYGNNYPARMSTKINDYLEPFKNRHICNNKLYNIGELLGIRNYIHVGNLLDSDKLWLSYKFKSVYDDKLIETFTESYTLPFKEYSLNRVSEHWKYDIYGNILSKTMMKNSGEICPWRKETEFLSNTNLTDIQKTIGCTLSKQNVCSGFCTFPCNGEINVPSGITWDLTKYIETADISNNIKEQWNTFGGLTLQNNVNAFIIPSAEYDRYIIAETDIEVCDDLEVNFTNDPIKVLKELTEANTMNTIEKTFRSIFQGFGGLENNVKGIPSYLARANNSSISGFMLADNTPFNGQHIITANTKIYGWDYEHNKKSNILPAGSFAIFRIKNWWSDRIKCTGKLLTKLVVDENNIVMPEKLAKVLDTTSKYDYVERMFGFFKYQQENLHKSNIYSIKLANSGLNPDKDEQLKYYTKNELISILETNNYYNKVFVYDSVTDSFSINSNSNSTLNAELDLNMNVSDVTTISFIDMYVISGWDKLILGKSEMYFNKSEEYQVSSKNKIRKNMRELLETAIRNSVVKYMPVDTTLWKIIYTGN